MPNTQNLKSYKKGQSGNPNGRPKGTPNRATVFRQMLWTPLRMNARSWQTAQQSLYGVSLLDCIDTANLTLYQIAALGQLISAAKGNTAAFREIQDTLFGKIPDRLGNSEVDSVIEVFRNFLTEYADQHESFPEILQIFTERVASCCNDSLETIQERLLPVVREFSPDFEL